MYVALQQNLTTKIEMITTKSLYVCTIIYVHLQQQKTRL
jgi:hypothetical protein